MARDRKDCQGTVAQLQRGLAVRPVRQTEEGLHAGQYGLHDSRAWSADKLAVPEVVVAVAVGVGGHEIDRGDAAPIHPALDDAVDGLANGEHLAMVLRVRRATGVEHHGSAVAEQQVDEVAFEAVALAQSQDKAVVVKRVYLDKRVYG